MNLLGFVFGVATRPRATFGALEKLEVKAVGPKCAAILGSAWAAFLVVLATNGHEPSGPLVLPIARADYYAFEAALAVPVYVAMFFVYAGVLHGFSRKSWLHAQSIAGGTMLVSSGFAFLLPDVLVYVAAGFDAIGPAMRFYLPISALWALVLGFTGVKAAFGLTNGRAAIASFVAFFAQTAVSAPILR